MKILFYPAARPLPNHLADVQLIFEEAGLRGLCLAGLALWRDGESGKGVKVTLPQRSYGAKQGRPAGRFSYLRGDGPALDKLKAEIVAEFLRRNPEIGGSVKGRKADAAEARQP